MLALKRAGREYALSQRVLAYEQELPTVAELLARPAWHADAACRGVDPGRFVTELGHQVDEETRALCRSCPVEAICREWAIAQGPELAGFFGGLTRAQRHPGLGSTREPTPPVGAGRCEVCRREGELFDADGHRLDRPCLDTWKRKRRPIEEAFESWAAARRAFLALAG